MVHASGAVHSYLDVCLSLGDITYPEVGFGVTIVELSLVTQRNMLRVTSRQNVENKEWTEIGA